MSHKFFITGTDTEVGKTYISAGLLRGFQHRGNSALGIKPVSTGCFWKNNILYNHDALVLQKFSSVKLDYNNINPFAFEPAIAPNIAANRANQILTVENISHKIQYALKYSVDFYIIEGIGGWHVPLNQHETMADFAKKLNLSIILVVGIRLGCLNHAILTHHQIIASGLHFTGWIANCLEPNVLESTEIIHTLKHWLKAPYLGTVNYQQKPEDSLAIKLLI